MKHLLLFFTIILLSTFAGAENKNTAPTTPNPQRKKALDFEDDLIEGMNKNPLDSLEHVARKDDKSRPYLYWKRGDFRREMKQNAHEIGYMP